MKKEIFDVIGIDRVRRALKRGLFEGDHAAHAHEWLSHAQNERKERLDSARNWIAATAIAATLLAAIANIFLG